MKKGKELEVLEDSETVKSFLRRVDRLRQLYYNVIVLFCTLRRNQGGTTGALNQGITGHKEDQCETST